MAQASIAADQGQSVFVAAIDWINWLLLGPVGNTIAVIAVALVGFSMLTGRTDLRRGGRVLLGCFILFGAGLIARGLMDLAALGGGGEIVMQTPPPPPPAPSNPQRNDPYAGASVPLTN